MSVAATERPANRRIAAAAHVGLLVLLTALVYSNTLHNEYHLDGIYGIAQNPEIKEVWPPWRHFVDPGTMTPVERNVQFRPLVPLTFSLDYFLASGHSLVVYHLTNILFHLIAVIIGYFLCLELLSYWRARSPDRSENVGLIAFSAAAVFAVHPVSGIPINYLFIRDVILLRVFLSAAFLAYLRMRRKGESVAGWMLVLGLYLCAFLSKTNAIVFPALILLFELVPAGTSPKSRALWGRVAAFVGVAVLFFGYTMVVLRFSDLSQGVDVKGYGVLGYGSMQAAVHVFHYLKNFVWPFAIRLLPAPPDGGLGLQTIVGLLVIIGSIVFAVLQVRRRPVVAFGILGYWVMLSATSSVVPLYYQVAHYRPYVASLFLFLAVALLLSEWLRPKLLLAGTVIAVLYFGIASFSLNRTYRTEETLFTQSVKYGAEATAHMNLAVAIADPRDPRVKEHLEEALRIDPNHALANSSLGLMYLDLGESERGIGLLERAAALAPSWPETHTMLAKGYLRLRRPHEAFAAASRAAELDPQNLEFQYRAARFGLLVGAYDQSLAFLDAIEGRDPEYEQVAFFRGLALQSSGRLEEAVAAYEGSLRKQEAFYDAHFRLGCTLMELGRNDEALVHLQRALSLKPDSQEAQEKIRVCVGESEARTN